MKPDLFALVYLAGAAAMAGLLLAPLRDPDKLTFLLREIDDTAPDKPSGRRPDPMRTLMLLGVLGVTLWPIVVLLWLTDSED